MNQNADQIAALLLETGKAHHAAFISTDGDDPEWPLWYAEYLQDRLPPLLGKKLTTSELTYFMMDFDIRQKKLAPDGRWYDFYANELLDRVQGLGNGPGGFEFLGEAIPTLSELQMVEVDRAMVEDWGISLIQMMENAGRNLAHLAQLRFLDGDPRGRQIAVLAGTGGNGGGVLAGARHLANHGADVSIFLTRSAETYAGVPARQLEILHRMGIFEHSAESLEPEHNRFDLILDGLIGYSLRGAPEGRVASMIRWANRQDCPILALDIPSGIDATSGIVHDLVITAAATMTLALPKSGLMAEDARSCVGELYLADIGVPPALYAGDGLELEVEPIFARGEIVRLR